MVSLRFTALALAALRAFTAVAQVDATVEELEEEVEDPSTSPNLKVKVSASFPQAEIFGVKLVNGNPTRAVLSFSNEEPEPVTVAFIGGSLMAMPGLDAAGPQVVRNLTVQRYNVEIPAGESESLTYTFATELHPQDLKLNIAAVLKDNKDVFYTMQVYNETVSIVEAPTSIFDLQIIFLYLILASAFAGTCYFIYNTWITTLFPQKRGRGKGGERAKGSSKQSKRVDPADQVSVIGADGPAVTSGAKAYDESWIPAGHLQRPEAKRVGSGRSTPKTARKA
ncbi:Increased recombination centers protein 22 [Coniosporium apollinis]|uniref:Increased recombination centers protein 22 n=1 Tax=Coniosporium apollinis TaxID=61459 RepID=A0ABQ9NL33_9PEZI|nr:Increased recombination centers protein 22 [Coniosporium apollinis]